MNGQLLTRIRVLDLTRAFAGPSAGQMLGDLGADVIKVERPGRGDESRALGRAWLKDKSGRSTSDSSMYLSVNRNKRGIAVDLSTKAGQDLIRSLAVKCDVLLENYKTGDLARYGLDYAAIRAVSPRIVYCSVTGFGQSGPYSHRPGYDPVFQAMGGWMALNGDTDEAPVLVASNPIDTATGYHLALAVLAALYERDANGGKGQHIDVALLDVSLAFLAQRAQDYLVDGNQPTRLSLRGIRYRCRNGAIVTAISTPSQWQSFCRVIERPDLGADPRFSETPGRVKHRDLLVPEIECVLAARDVMEVVNALDGAGVPCGPVYDFPSAFGDRHVRARGMTVEVEHPAAGPVTLLRNPIRFSETPITNYRVPPQLGEHTDEVLRDMLGLDADAIARLRSERVVA